MYRHVCAAGECWKRRTELAFLDDLARICCDESGYRLIIKLHPLSALKAGDLLGLLARSEKRASLLEIRGEGDAVEMLNETDLLVTVNSTTAYHALVRGIPVVTVNYLTEGLGEFDAYRYGGAIDVRRAEDLRRAIREPATSEDVRGRLHEGAQRVIENHLFRLDGLASARIAQAIKSVAREKRCA